MLVCDTWHKFPREVGEEFTVDDLLEFIAWTSIKNKEQKKAIAKAKQEAKRSAGGRGIRRRGR